jgi:hypothetical protein
MDKGVLEKIPMTNQNMDTSVAATLATLKNNSKILGNQKTTTKMKPLTQMMINPNM